MNLSQSLRIIIPVVILSACIGGADAIWNCHPRDKISGIPEEIPIVVFQTMFFAAFGFMLSFIALLLMAAYGRSGTKAELPLDEADHGDCSGSTHMSTEQAPPKTSRATYRWFQFRLRTLMLFVFLVAVGLTVYMQLQRHWRVQAVQQVVHTARERGWPDDPATIADVIANAQDVGASSQAASALVPLLADEDQTVRSRASFLITRIGTDAVPVLLDALKDKEVGYGAASGLAEFLPGVLPELQDILRSHPDEVVRERAIYIFYQSAAGRGRTLSKAEVSLLFEVLRIDKSAKVRRMAAIGITKVATQTSGILPELIRALDDVDTDNWPLVAEAISRADNTQFERIAPKLLIMLQDENASVRRRAAGIIGGFGTAAKSAEPALLEALNDTDWRVRRNSVFSLKSIDTRSYMAITTIIDCLEDSDPRVRAQAAWSLGDLSPESIIAVPALTKALEDEIEYVRINSSEALGKINKSANELK